MEARATENEYEPEASATEPAGSVSDGVCFSVADASGSYSSLTLPARLASLPMMKGFGVSCHRLLGLVVAAARIGLVPHLLAHQRHPPIGKPLDHEIEHRRQEDAEDGH